VQLGILAFIGALIGVALGAAAPYLLIALSANGIPLPQTLGIYPAPLFKALALGMLAATIFALPAIGRARATRPAALFRSVTEGTKTKPPLIEKASAFGAAIILVVLAVFTGGRPMMTGALLLGAIVAWGVFLLAAFFVRKLAQRLTKLTKGFWRLAFSNLAIYFGRLATLRLPMRRHLSSRKYPILKLKNLTQSSPQIRLILQTSIVIVAHRSCKDASSH